MQIEKVTARHVDEVARLFDLYRQFYECEADLELAKRYIGARVANSESDIFVAWQNNAAHGFVQLYPSFCSVEAIKIYILYDLYVDAASRRNGTGERLMKQATAFACENGAGRLDLLTEHSNTAGQRLYEKLGYEKVNENFYAYSLAVS